MSALGEREGGSHDAVPIALQPRREPSSDQSQIDSSHSCLRGKVRSSGEKVPKWLAIFCQCTLPEVRSVGQSPKIKLDSPTPESKPLTLVSKSWQRQDKGGHAVGRPI